MHFKNLKKYYFINKFDPTHIKKLNIEDNDISVDMNVLHEPYNNDSYGIIIRYGCKCNSKKTKTNIFHLELDYFGLFKLENFEKYSKDKITKESVKIIFPFARAIIASITQNGGSIPILLDNINLDLKKL